MVAAHRFRRMNRPQSTEGEQEGAGGFGDRAQVKPWISVGRDWYESMAGHEWRGLRMRAWA